MSKVPFLYFTALFLILGVVNLRADPMPEHWVEKNSEDPIFSSIMKEKAFVRHAKGMIGLGGFGGITSIGYMAGVEWSYRFLSSHLKLLLGREWRSHKHITYKNLFLEPLFYHTFFTNYDNFCFNLGIGTVVAYNKKQNKKLSRDFKSSYNVGVTLSAETELFIFKRLEMILAGGPVVYILKEPHHRISYQISISLKYNF